MSDFGNVPSFHYLSPLGFRKGVWWVCALFPLSLIGYWIVGGNSTWSSFRSIPCWAVFLALGCSLLNYTIRAVRWRCLVLQGHQQLGPFWGGIIYVAGLGLTASPGKVGELSRGWFAAHFGIRWSHIVIAFIAERCMDALVVAFMVCLLALIGVAAIPWTIIALFIFVLAVGLAALKAPGFRSSISVLILRIPFIRNVEPVEIQQSLAHVVAIQMVFKNAMYSLSAWCIQGCGFIFLCWSVSPYLSFQSLLFVFLVSMLLGSASGSPGGLGAIEAGLAGGLVLLGLQSNEAIGISFLFRLTSLWFATGLGFIFMWFGPLRWVSLSVTEPKSVVQLHNSNRFEK